MTCHRDMTIVTTIVKARIVAVARNQTMVAPGVGGHKVVTATAITKERTKATAANVATEASRVDAAALRVADVAVSTKAEVNTAEVVNPALEASTVEALTTGA